MTIMEKIKKMPMWKVILIALVGLSIAIGLIEEIVMMKIFTFMNHTADRMAVLFDEDKKDMDESDLRFYCERVSDLKDKQQKLEQYKKENDQAFASLTKIDIDYLVDRIEYMQKTDHLNPSMCNRKKNA